MAIMESHWLGEKGRDEGAWAWFLQRVSAGFLVVFLLAHFWVLHYAVVGERISFERVASRLQTPFFMALDSALLATAIYHGLYGVWAVMADFGVGRGVRKAVGWLLAVVGVITFVYGVNALFPFIMGRPLFYR